MTVYENLRAKFEQICTKSDKKPENDANARKRLTPYGKKNEPGKLTKLKKHSWTIMFVLVALAVVVGSTVAFTTDESPEEEIGDIDEFVNYPCSYHANCTNTGNLKIFP